MPGRPRATLNTEGVICDIQYTAKSIKAIGPIMRLPFRPLAAPQDPSFSGAKHAMCRGETRRV
jgi:hypothetical protein